jgi:hypothetical protein
MREGRRVTFDNLPDPRGSARDATRDYRKPLYKMLHSFNVLAFVGPKKYTPRNRNTSGWFGVLDLPTAKDAQTVCNMFDKTMLDGQTIRVSVFRIPMKHLGVSWDGGRPAGHGRPRDLGSAVGTGTKASVQTGCCSYLKCHLGSILSSNNRYLPLF